MSDDETKHIERPRILPTRDACDDLVDAARAYSLALAEEHTAKGRVVAARERASQAERDLVEAEAEAARALEQLGKAATRFDRGG